MKAVILSVLLALLYATIACQATHKNKKVDLGPPFHAPDSLHMFVPFSANHNTEHAESSPRGRNGRYEMTAKSPRSGKVLAIYSHDVKGGIPINPNVHWVHASPEMQLTHRLQLLDRHGGGGTTGMAKSPSSSRPATRIKPPPSVNRLTLGQGAALPVPVLT